MIASAGKAAGLLIIPVWVLVQGMMMSQARIEPLTIEGLTMGTSYHITYFDVKNRNFRFSVDSLLQVVNKSISTYDAGSAVSSFNRSRKGLTEVTPHLYHSLKKAFEVATSSDGAFDPTVMPLVNAWGFGPGKPLGASAAKIDSIRTFVGFDKIKFNVSSVTKTDPRLQLDFGGIGQGYAVDVISDFLKSKGITDFLVELGGEGIAFGRNLARNKSWQIGVLDPNSTRDHQFFKAYVEIKDGSFTTSGNYFNYREVNGKKYGHTIDPKSGYPVQHELLSASVFAGDCATADAWATAFMVVGVTKAMEFLKAHPELEALLIFTTPDGSTDVFFTPGLKARTRLED
jgi:FAD:protein FMN transferase